MLTAVAENHGLDQGGYSQGSRPRGETQSGKRIPSLPACIGAVLLVAGLLSDNPVLVLGAVTATTLGLLSRYLPIDVALPASVLSVLSAALLAGLAAGVTDVDLLARPQLLLAGYFGYALLPLLLRRPGRRTHVTPAPFGRVVAPAYLPAVLVAVLGLRQAFDDRLTASWAFLGTDAAQHLLYLRSVQQDGGLDYASNAYPQGVHMLLALVSVPGKGLLVPPDALLYDLRLWGAAVCFSFALVLWTSSCLVLRIAASIGVPRVAAVSAAGLTGLTLVSLTSFSKTFIVLAAVPSLIAIVVLWALPLTALVLPQHRSRPLALCLVGVVEIALLSHLWQALALAPAVAVVLAVGPAVWTRAGRQVALAGSHRLAGVVAAAAAVSLVVALAPLIAIREAGGLRLASIPGQAAAVPTLVLLAGVVSLGAVSVRVRQPWARATLGGSLALLTVAGVMLHSTGQGLDLTQYYPQKVLWFFSASLLPVAAALLLPGADRMCRLTWSALGSIGDRQDLLRAVVVALVVAVTFPFLVPALWIESGTVMLTASLRDGTALTRRLDIALEHGTTHGARVAVPVGLSSSGVPDPRTTQIIGKLFAFQTGQASSLGLPGQVCDDIRLVAAGKPAIVITALDTDYLQGLMRRRGCGQVPVVQVPGGGAHPAFLPKQ